MISGHFKQTTTYDASNPAEHISIPGGRTECSTEYSALSPRYTVMHASTKQHNCAYVYTAHREKGH